MASGTQHADVAADVLRACLDELPPRGPTVQAVPLLEALEALLAERPDDRRHAAVRGYDLGCYQWAAAVYAGFHGATRLPSDDVNEATLRVLAGDPAGAKRLLATVDPERLDLLMRVVFLHTRAVAALDTMTALSPPDRSRWAQDLERARVLVAAQASNTPDPATFDDLCTSEAAMALALGDPERAETLLRELPARQPLEEMRLGDLLQGRGARVEARAHWARALDAAHPEAPLAAELRRRLDPPVTPPSPSTPYR